MNRQSYYAKADVGASTIDFKMTGGGNAVLVLLRGNSTPTVTVDFQETIDGVTYVAAPYTAYATASPARSVTQISDPTTATLYLVLPPVTQFRVAVGAISVGTLDVILREVFVGGFVI